MTLAGHLAELRLRLAISLAAFVAGTLICFWRSTDVWRLILQPLKHIPSVTLVNLAPSEGIMADWNACAIGGLLLSAPVLLYQAWRFVSPALAPREKRLALPWLLLASGLFAAGFMVAWIGLVPMLLGFFASYNAGLASQQWTQSAYAGFLLRSCLLLGFYFELPALAWWLARLGWLQARHLLEYGRISIFVICFLAALWSPPDAFSMLVFAVPMLAVYAIAILFAWHGSRGGRHG